MTAQTLDQTIAKLEQMGAKLVSAVHVDAMHDNWPISIDQEHTPFFEIPPGWFIVCKKDSLVHRMHKALMDPTAEFPPELDPCEFVAQVARATFARTKNEPGIAMPHPSGVARKKVPPEDPIAAKNPELHTKGIVLSATSIATRFSTTYAEVLPDQWRGEDEPMYVTRKSETSTSPLPWERQAFSNACIWQVPNAFKQHVWDLVGLPQGQQARERQKG